MTAKPTTLTVSDAGWEPRAHVTVQLLTIAGYAPEKIEYGINRYINETRRLYSVMESHLEKKGGGFLVGDRLTIADIICVGWANSHSTSSSLFHSLYHRPFIPSTPPQL